MSKKLSLEEKVQYMRIGLDLAGVNVNDTTAELVVKIYEGVLSKGGKFSLEDAVNIEVEVTGKYTKKEVKTEPAETVNA